MNKSENYNSNYLGIVILLAALGQFSFLGEKTVFVLLKVVVPMIYASYGARLEFKKNSKWSDERLLPFAKEFLVPYFWFSLIYVLLDAIRFFAGVKTVSGDNNIVSDVLKSISLYGASVMWYLSVLFLGMVIYSILRQKINYFVLLIIIGILTGVIIFIPLDDVVSDLNNITVRQIPVMVAMFCWRTVLACLYIAIGEGLGRVVRWIGKRKILSLVTGIVVTAIGTLILIYDGESCFESIVFEKWYFFFSGTIIFAAGIYLIAYWMGQATVFEFLGNNARIVYLTMIDFGIIRLCTEYIDGFVLRVFDNYFLSHIVSLIAFVVIELLIIIIVNRFLYFLVGKECNKTFGLNRTEKE